MNFATKLKCYRRMLKLTQNAVAEAMGVDRSTYSYYETGKTLPSSEGIQLLSHLFGISPAVLLNEKPIEPPSLSNQPRMLHDSSLEYFFKDQKKQEVDMSFPDLTEDEKQMVLRYRIMKAAERNNPPYPGQKDDIIRKFLAEYYK